MSRPIRTRLTMWYVGLLAAVFLVLGGFLMVRLHAGLIRGLDDSLATRAAQISLGLQGGCEGEFQDVSDASLVGLPQGESAAQLLSPAGKVTSLGTSAIHYDRSLAKKATSAGSPVLDQFSWKNY